MMNDDYDDSGGGGDDDDNDDIFTHRLFETVKCSSLQCRLHLYYNSPTSHSEFRTYYPN